MGNELKNFPFTQIVSGEVSGSTTAKQLPDIVSAGLVHIKAEADNAGSVCVGGAGVTMPDGTTDTTTGIPLAAKDEIILNIDNLNRIYIICTNAGDDITYLIMR